jgi:hypothetical protein
MSVVTKARLLKHAQKFGPIEVLEAACELLSPVEVCELAKELIELAADAAKRSPRPEWLPSPSAHPSGHRALRNRMRRPPEEIVDMAIRELTEKGQAVQRIARTLGVGVQRVKVAQNSKPNQSYTDADLSEFVRFDLAWTKGLRGRETEIRKLPPPLFGVLEGAAADREKGVLLGRLPQSCLKRWTSTSRCRRVGTATPEWGPPFLGVATS